MVRRTSVGEKLLKVQVTFFHYYNLFPTPAVVPTIDHLNLFPVIKWKLSIFIFKIII